MINLDNIKEAVEKDKSKLDTFDWLIKIDFSVHTNMDDTKYIEYIEFKVFYRSEYMRECSQALVQALSKVIPGSKVAVHNSIKLAALRVDLKDENESDILMKKFIDTSSKRMNTLINTLNIIRFTTNGIPPNIYSIELKDDEQFFETLDFLINTIFTEEIDMLL